MDPLKMPQPKPLWANVTPQIQHWPDSCGWTSCAVAIDALMGKKLTDGDLKLKYGGALLSALNAECAPKYHWSDDGDFNRSKWPKLEHMTRNGFPFIIGLNGQFSVTGHGHIVCVFKIDGDQVWYTDSAEGPAGHIKVTTREAIENCPPHPQGKFLLVCEKARVF